MVRRNVSETSFMTSPSAADDHIAALSNIIGMSPNAQAPSTDKRASCLLGSVTAARSQTPGTDRPTALVTLLCGGSATPRQPNSSPKGPMKRVITNAGSSVYYGENGNGSPIAQLTAAPRYFTAGMPMINKAHQPSGIRHKVIRRKKRARPLIP
jgi:hypothetical protein